jgi:Tfp pilus assembly protein PilX
MKKIKTSSKPFIIAAIVAMMMFFATASAFAEVTRTGNTFSVEQTTTQDKATNYTWKDSKGKVYTVYVSSKGSCYVKKISAKTGKEYKYYLPKEVQATIKKELNI